MYSSQNIVLLLVPTEERFGSLSLVRRLTEISCFEGTFNRQLYGRKVLCVQRNLWCVENGIQQSYNDDITICVTS
jgi:hypothetical protein